VAWLGLSYTLAAGTSSRRVTLWRRLRRLGAVSPTSGLYLLPDRPDCAEAFQWLAQEIQDGGGEALRVRIERLEGRSDAQLIATFQSARRADYKAVAAEVRALERRPASKRDARHASDSQDRRHLAFDRLRRRFSELRRIDFFDCPEGAAVARRFDRLERSFDTPPLTLPNDEPVLDRARYRGRRWVTRPRPHVDRLACAWLIRRFIDPGARIRYAERARAGEVGFDMAGAEFGHRGGRTSFETLLAAFELEDPGLRALATIVHAIDLGEPLTHPAAEGVAAILDGWRRTDWKDAELERHGVALYEGLYRTLTESLARPSKPRRGKA